MSIECVTFDLDDTLWEVGPVIERAESRFYEWLEANCPRVTERFSAEDLLEHRRAFFARMPDRGHDLTWLRTQWLTRLLAGFGYPPQLASEAFRVFWTHRNAVDLFADARAALEGLRERYAVGVITNGNACVETIGIGHWFDFVVSSQAAGAAKPSAEIFELALARAGVRAARAVHVGDDPKNDVLGASSVGMRTVWYNPGLRPWPGGRVPDAVIRALSELEDTLARMAR